METWGNILKSAPPLSLRNFDAAHKLLNVTFSIPDCLITSSVPIMLEKAKEIIRELEIARGWKIQHIVIPELKDGKQYRWFVADSRKAAGHFKDLTGGYCELAMLDWSWIVASLSDTCPITQ